MDRRRIIAIVAFLIASIILGYIVYRVFFRKEERIVVQPPPPGVTTPTAPGAFPSAGGGVPTGEVTEAGELPTAGRIPTTPRVTERLPEVQKVVESRVVGTRTDQSGVHFYDTLDGKFYRVLPNGNVVRLSDQVFYNVSNVTWSPQTNESIIEYPDGNNIYYNFDTRRQVTLPRHWEDFSFSGDGSSIAAKSIGFSPENRWLVTASPDGNGVSLVTPLGENADKVIVDWSPNNQIVALSRTGDSVGADRQEIFFVGLHGENFKSTIVEGRDLRSRWSTDGKKLVYSVYSAESDFKPELWVVNAEGDTIGSGRRMLNIETWADKCAFANNTTLYCGVPETLEGGEGFAPSIADTTRDKLFRIDVTTGVRSEIPLEDFHVIDSLSITPDGESLYFTDKTQNGIFSVNI